MQIEAEILTRESMNIVLSGTRRDILMISCCLCLQEKRKSLPNVPDKSPPKLTVPSRENTTTPIGKLTLYFDWLFPYSLFGWLFLFIYHCYRLPI